MLSNLQCYSIHNLLCRLYKKKYHTFMGLTDIARAQHDKLMAILNSNQNTVYGNLYSFPTLSSIADFQEAVPLCTYEDLLPYIERICHGEDNILTAEKVLMLEPTSGSSAASKWIPYTRGLKKDFQAGLLPWLYDLYSGWPGLQWGKSYWSITPPVHKETYTSGGIPVGFEDDSQYFGALEKHLLPVIFAASGREKAAETMEEFYFETARALLSCRNLALISIWNPTFLTLILEYMEENEKDLVKDLKKTYPRFIPAIEYGLKERAYEVIWPQLQLISSWCDGQARHHAQNLQNLFPHVTLQPKGVLATEGFISFPLKGAEGSVLSIQSHFFEFMSLTHETIYLAHELEKGEKYAVILTTSGGLYRYQLKDVITVLGHKGVFPLIQFSGKLDKVSDLFGEKLHELFVKEVLDPIIGFAMLAPKEDHYVLYAEEDLNPREIDHRLQSNFHYDHCRQLGQLKPLRLFKLTGNPEQEYVSEMQRQNQRLGDIKLTPLSLQKHWDHVFKGEYQ